MRPLSLVSRVPLAALVVLAACRNTDTPRQCLDDEYEPNHSVDDAHPIPFTAGEFAATEMFLCAGDQDWYAISASPGQAIEFGIDFIHNDGDLDLELYTSAYGLVAASSSLADNEFVRYVVPTEGSYYVRVTGKDPSSTNVYTIGAALLGDACVADQLEPNDSPVQPSALTVGANPNLTMCAFEEDWYAIPAVQGQVINARASFDPALYDLALTLYVAEPLQEIASSDSTNDIEQIVRRVSDSGNYLLRVQNKPNLPRAEYALDLELSGDACSPDATEPNDSYFNATLVTGTQAFTDLEVCFGDQDWYQLELSNGQAVTARLEFDSAEYDLGTALYLLNDDGTLTTRATSDTLSGDEVVSFRPWEDGTYVLSVYGSRGTVFGAYDLSFDVSGSTCVVDLNEPNDGYANATVVDSGTFGGLTLCVGDQDWYQYDVAAGQLIEIGLDYDTAISDLAVNLYQLNDDGTITSRMNQDLVGDTEHLVYRPFENGTYLTSVSRSRGTAIADYSFDVNISGTECIDDSSEPNNVSLNASPLTLAVTHDQTMCVGDADWYAISAQGGQIINVAVNFEEGDEDLGVQIYKLNTDGTVTLRATSDVLDADEVVQYQPFDSGTFLVYVYRSRGTAVADYTVRATVTGTVCTDDTFEPNNQPLAPAVLTPGVRNGLSLCVADVDYYRLTAGNGQVIDVQADIDVNVADVALTLYKLNSDGTYVTRASVDALDTDEHLVYQPYETGDFMLAVSRSRGTTTASYDLNYQLLGTACVEDLEEPNNNGFEAAPLADGTYAARTLCVNDVDYYELDLNNGETVTIDVLFDQADADLGVTLFKRLGEGTLVSRASSDDLTDNERLVYSPFEDGEFVLQVFRSRGTTTASYDLVIDTAGGVCLPDPEEPNNTQYEAATVTLTGPADNRTASLVDRAVCTSDADYYRLPSVGRDQLVFLDLTFVDSESDLSLALLKANLDGTYTSRATSNTNADREIIAYRAVDAGPYVIGVTRNTIGTSMGPQYDLNVGITGRACVLDTYEPNDHWLAASTTFPQNGTLVSALTTCVNDVDYYALGTIPGSRAITINATFNAADTDIGVQLYRLNLDNTLTSLVNADTLGTSSESIVYTTGATTNDAYMLRVYRSNLNGPALYNLSVNVP